MDKKVNEIAESIKKDTSNIFIDLFNSNKSKIKDKLIWNYNIIQSVIVQPVTITTPSTPIILHYKGEIFFTFDGRTLFFDNKFKNFHIFLPFTIKDACFYNFKKKSSGSPKCVIVTLDSQNKLSYSGFKKYSINENKIIISRNVLQMIEKNNEIYYLSFKKDKYFLNFVSEDNGYLKPKQIVQNITSTFPVSFFWLSKGLYINHGRSFFDAAGKKFRTKGDSVYEVSDKIVIYNKTKEGVVLSLVNNNFEIKNELIIESTSHIVKICAVFKMICCRIGYKMYFVDVLRNELVIVKEISCPTNILDFSVNSNGLNNIILCFLCRKFTEVKDNDPKSKDLQDIIYIRDLSFDSKDVSSNSLGDVTSNICPKPDVNSAIYNPFKTSNDANFEKEFLEDSSDNKNTIFVNNDVNESISRKFNFSSKSAENLTVNSTLFDGVSFCKNKGFFSRPVTKNEYSPSSLNSIFGQNDLMSDKRNTVIGGVSDPLRNTESHFLKQNQSESILNKTNGFINTSNNNYCNLFTDALGKYNEDYNNLSKSPLELNTVLDNKKPSTTENYNNPFISSSHFSSNESKNGLLNKSASLSEKADNEDTKSSPSFGVLFNTKNSNMDFESCILNHFSRLEKRFDEFERVSKQNQIELVDKCMNAVTSSLLDFLDKNVKEEIKKVNKLVDELSNKITLFSNKHVDEEKLLQFTKEIICDSLLPVVEASMDEMRVQVVAEMSNFKDSEYMQDLQDAISYLKCTEEHSLLKKYIKSSNFNKAIELVLKGTNKDLEELLFIIKPEQLESVISKNLIALLEKIILYIKDGYEKNIDDIIYNLLTYIELESLDDDELRTLIVILSQIKDSELFTTDNNKQIIVLVDFLKFKIPKILFKRQKSLKN